MSDAENATEPGISALEVILVGAGQRAEAWETLVRRSALIDPIARVSRVDTAGSGGVVLPHFSRLEDALGAFPNAVVAAALPPRAGLETAIALAFAGRRGLVEAPLHGALATMALPAEAAGIQVAHGWVTMRGRAGLEQAIAARPLHHAEIEVRGLPEEAGGDVGEVLVHALALASRIFPTARVDRAELVREGAIEVALTVSPTLALRVVAIAKGRGLDVRVTGAAFEGRWTWAADRESIAFTAPGSRPQRVSREVQPAEVRALHQLVDPRSAGGDSLPEAARAMRLVRATLEAIGRPLVLGARQLRHAARIATARPTDVLAQLGLRGELPAAEPARVVSVPTPQEPLELWAFRAGKKPVVFLTARPHEVAALRASFEGAHIEQRERLVHVGAQDAWIDRRDVGEPRIELYISRDRSLAERAAKLQTEGDPSGSLRELGGFMGYPPCCVEAFATQADRSNNTQNRYATAARSPRNGPWPWELNNLSTMLIPFYPCSYGCAEALSFARAAIGAMDAAHPGAIAGIRPLLAHAVLYFDHDRVVLFEGEASGNTIRYTKVGVPPWAPAPFAAFAGALAAGDALTLDDAALSVRAAGREIFTFARTDPGLGIIAPFGEAP